jgi:hypothetical protein
MFSPVCRAAAVAALLVLLPASGPASALWPAVAAELNERELSSLEAAARQYRVTVYQTYRLDRAEFDRRRAAVDQVHASWREAGGHPEDLSAVLGWLREATYSSQPEIRQPLPELPDFGRSRGAGSKTEQGPVANEGIAPSDRQGSGRVTARSSAPGTNVPTLDRRAPPAPKVNGYEIAPPRQFAPPAAVQNIIAPPPARQPANVSGGPAPAAAQPRIGRALLPAPWDVVTTAPSRPTADVGAAPRRGGEAGKLATPPRVERPSRIASAAKDRERAVTAAAPAPLVPPRVALAKPSVARSVAKVGPALATSQLNVGELLARASGYEFGLRTIGSVLDDQASLDAAELAQLLGELEALVEQRGDLMLYEQLVSAAVQQRLVQALDFPQTTVAALGSRIAAARERLAQQTDLSDGQRQVELQSLAALSKRLARLRQD